MSEVCVTAVAALAVEMPATNANGSQLFMICQALLEVNNDPDLAQQCYDNYHYTK